MVQIRYKGINTLFVGGYALKNGVNEMRDEDFWRLLKTKTFLSRVESKILEVPEGFPMEKPVKKSETKTQSESNVIVADAGETEKETDSHVSVKATLKLISQADIGYLEQLIASDSRPVVQEEAKKKLKSLKG